MLRSVQLSKQIAKSGSYRFQMGRFMSATTSSGSEQQSGAASNANQAADAAAAPAQNDDQITQLNGKITELEKAVKENRDNFLRALADAENLRERTRREKEHAHQLAIKSFAKDLLSIPDILEMALKSVPEQQLDKDVKCTEDTKKHLLSLHEGLKMTLHEMFHVFKRNGLEQYSPVVGDKFDPNVHQAMFQVPPNEQHKDPGSVFTVTMKGYKLHGIVLRAAQVGVIQSDN
ncbi:hypothetical protein MP228_007373 [Amoeboaphelidium protococcarum]|nr:hypothetical protein MP228_007373 [Amoeboaphelidium protococcarum]